MENEIRKIRKRFNLTQVRLAEMLGVSQTRISNMERQKTVTLDMLRKIAKALRVSVKDLINNSE